MVNIKYQGKRNRKLFWLPAIAPLVSVILSTAIVYLTRADEHGVKIIKHVKGGLNPSSVNQLQFNSPHLRESVKIGLVCAIIALTVRIEKNCQGGICKLIIIFFLRQELVNTERTNLQFYLSFYLINT